MALSGCSVVGVNRRREITEAELSDKDSAAQVTVSLVAPHITSCLLATVTHTNTRTHTYTQVKKTHLYMRMIDM